jgi:hypothetical protein
VEETGHIYAHMPVDLSLKLPTESRQEIRGLQRNFDSFLKFYFDSQFT